MDDSCCLACRFKTTQPAVPQQPHLISKLVMLPVVNGTTLIPLLWIITWPSLPCRRHDDEAWAPLCQTWYMSLAVVVPASWPKLERPDAALSAGRRHPRLLKTGLSSIMGKRDGRMTFFIDINLGETTWVQANLGCRGQP